MIQFNNLKLNFKPMIVTLEEVKNEDKTSKAGKTYTNCSIKVNGEWRNGFGNKVTKSWQAGEQVDVDLFEEDYNGKTYKKFKALSKNDLLEDRIKNLEKAMSVVVSEIKKLKQVSTAEKVFETKVVPDDLPF